MSKEIFLKRALLLKEVNNVRLFFKKENEVLTFGMKDNLDDASEEIIAKILDAILFDLDEHFNKRKRINFWWDIRSRFKIY